MSGTASANTIYYVDLTLGAGGTATGDIVTDSTIGTLGAVNFLDWDLTVNDGANGPVNLLGPLSGNNSTLYFQGSAVSATAYELRFDFSSPAVSNAYMFFASGFSFLCFGGGGAGGYSKVCDLSQPGNVETVLDQGGLYQSNLLTGTQVIAQTPLPAALPLFTAAVGAAGLFGWRRKRKAQAAV